MMIGNKRKKFAVLLGSLNELRNSNWFLLGHGCLGQDLISYLYNEEEEKIEIKNYSPRNGEEKRKRIKINQPQSDSFR